MKLRQSSFRFKVIWFKAWAPRFGFMGTVPSKSVEDLGLCITGTWNPAHPASSELYRSIQTMGLLFASASFLSPKLQQAYHQINGMQAMSWDFAESPLNCLLWIIKCSFSITFFFFPGSHKPRETNQGGPGMVGSGKGVRGPGGAAAEPWAGPAVQLMGKLCSRLPLPGASHSFGLKLMVKGPREE